MGSIEVNHPYEDLIELGKHCRDYFYKHSSPCDNDSISNGGLALEISDYMLVHLKNVKPLWARGQSDSETFHKFYHFYLNQDDFIKTQLSQIYPIEKINELATIGLIAQSLNRLWDITSINPQSLKSLILSADNLTFKLPKPTAHYTTLLNKLFPPITESGQFTWRYNLKSYLEFLQNTIQSEFDVLQKKGGELDPFLEEVSDKIDLCMMISDTIPSILEYHHRDNPLYARTWKTMLSKTDSLIEKSPFTSFASEMMRHQKKLLDICENHYKIFSAAQPKVEVLVRPVFFKPINIEAKKKGPLAQAPSVTGSVG